MDEKSNIKGLKLDLLSSTNDKYLFFKRAIRHLMMILAVAGTLHKCCIMEEIDQIPAFWNWICSRRIALF